MRDKIRGRAECTSAHGSYYNFLGKKSWKAERDVLFCFDFWFFGRGARWSYCSILQRAFWQHFSQNQFWSRHFFLQLTHHRMVMTFSKSKEHGKISLTRRQTKTDFALCQICFSLRYYTMQFCHKNVASLLWLKNEWLIDTISTILKQKRKSALQTCLIFLVKRMSVTFDTVKLKWVQ